MSPPRSVASSDDTVPHASGTHLRPAAHRAPRRRPGPRPGRRRPPAPRPLCSKSTLYRQWRTKPQFVAAALRSSGRARFALIDTGTLAGDLREAARCAGEWSPGDATLFQALGHAVLQDRELAQALREALVDPEIAALEGILRRGAERGEVDADNPALEYVPAQFFGVLRARPVLEGRNADPDYVLRFVEAAVLPALGLE
ncbi:TetR-like C-terminal domain-containing protein [Streptomyces albogriseolus]|uniref:TetR-like C-terminal domain-containing protein n=1 Tax=Streptomyces albogriseolus TaxID=1887 RepID=UPI0033A2EBC4